MKIPKNYKLFDSTITVEYAKDLAQSARADGQWYASRNLIKLQEANNEYDSDSVEVTFWHEWVHSILDNIGEYEKSKDEKFVDLFARLAKQSINTMEFCND